MVEDVDHVTSRSHQRLDQLQSGWPGVGLERELAVEIRQLVSGAASDRAAHRELDNARIPPDTIDETTQHFVMTSQPPGELKKPGIDVHAGNGILKVVG